MRALSFSELAYVSGGEQEMEDSGDGGGGGGGGESYTSNQQAEMGAGETTVYVSGALLASATALDTIAGLAAAGVVGGFLAVATPALLIVGAAVGLIGAGTWLIGKFGLYP